MNYCVLLSTVAVFLTPSVSGLSAQDGPSSLFEVKSFCIAAPKPQSVDRFNEFIRQELKPHGVNTLVLRVDYGFQYKEYPQLADANALSVTDVNQLVATCEELQIRLIPQINLLGHQSWHGTLGNLLKVFPEFDETPHVELPEEYKWPNDDGLYCKSYCPLHPEVHSVVFACVDEVCEAFESDAFHAGLDEVFYIGDDKCPRCSGKDRAELFANEVNKIRDHLAKSNRELWIWGDRLIDGAVTGMGQWEASTNDTHRAIDLISKDVVICDWHYERPDKTPVLFASKGFRVLSAVWNRPEVAIQQTVDMANFRETATEAMKPRYAGMMQTIWSPAESYMRQVERRDSGQPESRRGGDARSEVDCFRRTFDQMKLLETRAATEGDDASNSESASD